MNFDMLVKLYDLPQIPVMDEVMQKAGITIVRPLAADKYKISAYIRKNFSEAWANEFERSMANTPISCFVAINEKREIVGFSCYDVSCRNFFGPIGVSEECRGKHVGQELVRCAMYAMREEGYAYAIIGWCEEYNRIFYEKACNAVVIPNSFPGIYKNLLEY